ncbi:uncharacterized protein LOC133365026 [Rhineura floridana]|uniref:uncharacterized protein LOC133365026 n=1 Tax=Rhineura floridana TaxID=261503 RepID=UPI002AC81332|nr:uncharacterized protein LOC133365026 [Rhineura floridana]XP_061442202.1 uncharacterized protein LOC133365026 [Rhineura floridana]XP_061442203.1 uncharacterized protein LOC133365026 [Rhineura floridana]
MKSVPVPLFLFFSILSSTVSQVVIHYTSSGGTCGDTCGYHGYAYTWCKQSGGNGKAWGYCSLEEGLEASGKHCASSCDFWGGSYRYCHLKNGGWNYCGLLRQQDFFPEYSQDNNMCLSSCRASKGCFQCDTAHGTQRCSPFRDVTPSGLPCHDNYRCGKFGHDVYRCQINNNESNWDSCGRKSLDKCVWFYSLAEICILPISQKEGQIIFRRERRANMLPPTKEEFKNAVHLIDNITSITSLPDVRPLATVHLYKQESIFCKGINYTNVEVKIGSANETVPIAHVLVPEFLSSVEVLRLAFYTSLHSTFYQPAYTIAVSIGEPMLCSLTTSDYPATFFAP